MQFFGYANWRAQDFPARAPWQTYGALPLDVLRSQCPPQLVFGPQPLLLDVYGLPPTPAL